MSNIEEKKNVEEKVINESKPAAKTVPIIILLIGAVILVLAYAEVFGGTYYNYTDRFVPPLAATLTGYSVVLFGIIMLIAMAGCRLQITDKRVCGKGLFGKRVDIPIDSISAVGMIGWLKGVSVASSSGSISFYYLANATELHNVLSELLIARQRKETTATSVVMQEVHQSSADELKKFKELLDSGIISQEEFDAKKKQLLGL